MKVVIKLILISIALLLSLILSCSFNSSDGQDVSDDDLADDDDTSIDYQPENTTPPNCEEGQNYSEPYPIIIRGPYLQMVDSSSIHIVWYTDRPSNSVVRYGIDDLVFSVCDFNPVERHEVVLKNLLPSREYIYLVRSDGTEKGLYSFKTAPKIFSNEKFRFGVYGDNQSHPETHAEVANGLLAENPDLFINVGDIVGNGEDLDSYDVEFFNPASELIANTPFYISIGNHEKESPYFYEFFSFPNNEMWYSFVYGDALFICLNTNRLYIWGSPQYEWFERELQQASELGVEWIFVFAHHPPYCEGWGNPNYDGEVLVRTILMPLLEQYGVDIYFSGHAHDYERGELNGVVYIITGGGGGSLDTWQRDFPHITVYESAHHYVKVDVQNKTLTLKACYPNGECFDELVVEH